MLCRSVSGYGDSSKCNSLICKLRGTFHSLANSAVLLGAFAVTSGLLFLHGKSQIVAGKWSLFMNLFADQRLIPKGRNDLKIPQFCDNLYPVAL